MHVSPLRPAERPRGWLTHGIGTGTLRASRSAGLATQKPPVGSTESTRTMASSRPGHHFAPQEEGQKNVGDEQGTVDRDHKMQKRQLKPVLVGPDQIYILRTLRNSVPRKESTVEVAT